MDRWPRISIVTPSFNQGQYIAETIDSVLAQGYPNVEHIVMDGGSTDNTLDILRRYTHLKVISEPDRGQADAINKGFRLVTGEIWGFLNSDDTLLPGALHRVAQEIDPAHGRHIVMGRCRFIDAQGRFIGIEHPSYFVSHRRVLEIWKGHGLPQPAIFWTPEVWRECGPMDESLYHLDYDLFCRFSQKYRFHCVDQVFATYRLHAESKTDQWTEADRLKDSIQLSRRYWGSPFSPTYWQLALSLAWYQFNRTGKARAFLRQAQDAWSHQRRLQAIPYAVAGTVLAPEVAFYVSVYPALREHAKGVVKRVLDRLAEMRGVYPQTAVYFDRSDLWQDGWAGPQLIVACEAIGYEQQVEIQGWAELKYMRQPLVLTLRVDGQQVSVHHLSQGGAFTWRVPLPIPLSPGQHTVEVQANNWFVLHRFTRNGDFRPLSWRAESIAFQTE